MAAEKTVKVRCKDINDLQLAVQALRTGDFTQRIATTDPHFAKVAKAANSFFTWKQDFFSVIQKPSSDKNRQKVLSKAKGFWQEFVKARSEKISRDKAGFESLNTSLRLACSLSLEKNFPNSIDADIQEMIVDLKAINRFQAVIEKKMRRVGNTAKGVRENENFTNLDGDWQSSWLFLHQVETHIKSFYSRIDDFAEEASQKHGRYVEFGTFQGEMALCLNFLCRIHAQFEDITAEIVAVLSEINNSGDLSLRVRTNRSRGKWQELINALNRSILFSSVELKRLQEVNQGIIDGIIPRPRFRISEGKLGKIHSGINEFLEIIQQTIQNIVLCCQVVGTGRNLNSYPSQRNSQGKWQSTQNYLDNVSHVYFGYFKAVEGVLSQVLQGTFKSIDWKSPSKGVFSEYRQNLFACVDTVNRFQADLNQAFQKIGNEGNFDMPIRDSQFTGEWQETHELFYKMAGDLYQQILGINETIAALVGGDFSNIDAFETHGAFGGLQNSLKQVGSVLRSFAEKVQFGLRKIGSEDQFSVKIDCKNFQGIWLEFCQKFNGMASQLKNQVGEIQSVTNSVIIGDFSKKIKLSVSGELFTINSMVNKMVDTLNGFSGEVSKVATDVGIQRKLGIQANISCLEGEWRELAKDINTMAAHLTSQVLNCADITTEVAVSSKNLKGVSAQMREEADTTANEANIVASAAERLNQNVQLVASGIEELGFGMQDIGKKAAKAAKVGSQAVESANNTNRNIQLLSKSSTQIDNVIKVITDIAEQTNLLALNATIEAARAGDAGKGFAVVANEVKELAKETAKATEHIRESIKAIQDDTRNAVVSIEEIGNIIGNINEIQTNIAASVEEQNTTTIEIAHNVGNAAMGSKKISKNIEMISIAAKGTQRGAANSLVAAAGLSELAAELQKVVGNFKIDFHSSKKIFQKRNG